MPPPSLRPNNFDLARLLLAFTVVLAHCADLSASPNLRVIRLCINPLVAVDGFFAISGFLIFASYERCASLKEYASKRAHRILPGYWLATLLCLAIAFSYGTYHVAGFLIANLSFLIGRHMSIEGVFSGNPMTSAMNGALWTIKVEVMFYCSVPVIVWICRRWQRESVLLAIAGLSLLYTHLTRDHGNLSAQLPGQMSFFMLGALIYYHLPGFRMQGHRLAIVAALLYVVFAVTGWEFLRPVAITVLTLWGCLLLPHMQGPARWGDFSFGAYVLHFPLIQLLVARGAFRAHPWLAVVEVLVLVSIGALFSWFGVEKPALGRVRLAATVKAF